MKYRQLSANMTAEFAEKLAALLEGDALSAIDPAVRAHLIARIGELPASLVEAQAEVAVKQDEAMAAVSAKDEIKTVLDTVLSQIAATLRAGRAPQEQFEMAGFCYPFGVRSSVIPNAPTELSAVGAKKGVNTGRFTGNNKHGRIAYEIWRREGETGEWMMVSGASKQSFTDQPVVPGQYYEYKVRAKAAAGVSEFSEAVGVYGAA
jgi:hypothetical protein